jgi:hypothetical protein
VDEGCKLSFRRAPTLPKNNIGCVRSTIDFTTGYSPVIFCFKNEKHMEIIPPFVADGITRNIHKLDDYPYL